MISFHNRGLKTKVEGLEADMQICRCKQERWKEGNFPNEVCKFFIFKKERDLQRKRGKSYSTAGAMVTVKGKNVIA